MYLSMCPQLLSGGRHNRACILYEAVRVEILLVRMLCILKGLK